jgi:predicted ATPase
MRVAVSGSHGTGKSTLIAAFLERRPEYAYEPEAYEALADDVALTSSEGPTPEGLESLLQYTVSAVAGHPPGTCVIFERGPADYLAYAAASRRTWSPGETKDFLETYVPVVRESVRHLDLIAFVPVSRGGPIIARPDDDPRFRKRVDEALRRVLIDDDHGLFGDGSALVVELPPSPEAQLTELMRRVLR